MGTKIVKVDYGNVQHAEHLIKLMSAYAMDEMGGAEPLSEFTQKNLAATLSTLPHAFSVLAYVDDKPAGLINCFEGFSTFMCKPLVNVHDVIVAEAYRGLGISHRMLEEVEQIAVNKGCGKITLEVLQGNKVARSSYLKHGFKPYCLDPEMGQAEFWHKYL